MSEMLFYKARGSVGLTLSWIVGAAFAVLLFNEGCKMSRSSL